MKKCRFKLDSSSKIDDFDQFGYKRKVIRTLFCAKLLIRVPVSNRGVDVCFFEDDQDIPQSLFESATTRETESEEPSQFLRRAASLLAFLPGDEGDELFEEVALTGGRRYAIRLARNMARVARSRSCLQGSRSSLCGCEKGLIPSGNGRPRGLT